MENCLHENFKAQVNVGRLSETDGGPITHYTADITINCADCNQQFEFIGVPAGMTRTEPRTSVDFTELRAPIRPFTNSIASQMKFQIAEQKNNQPIN